MTHLDDGADLRAVMDRSLRDLDAPDHCGPTAIASGRRMRTRRRLAVGLTGAAVITVAVASLSTLGGSGSATPETPFASDPTPTPARPTPTASDPMTPSPGPNQVPSSWPELPAGWWDMPSTQMLDHLRQLLPAGVTVETAVTTLDSPGDEDREANGGLSGTLSASTGPGHFQILLHSPGIDPSEIPDPVTTTDAAGNEHTSMMAQATQLADKIQCRGYHDTCQPIRDAGGEQIGRVSTNTERGTLLYEAFLLGPDGGGLNLTVMNSSGEKPGYEAPSAQVPPLTTAQLRALAEEPAWTSYEP